MIARCLTNEKYARPVFYGAMMCEGIVACVWALAGIAAFPEGYVGLKAMIAQGGPGLVVNHIATTYLGVFGGVMAILAVAIFPITSGDTAFRSLRLTIMDDFCIHTAHVLILFTMLQRVRQGLFVVLFFPVGKKLCQRTCLHL